ncbi:MAG TPA: VWA domain-containing protein [Thermoanaerobaculia bacterium]|nr:VWA domain-containing protein [Thermoanaerobaculia bacterium]
MSRAVPLSVTAALAAALLVAARATAEEPEAPLEGLIFGEEVAVQMVLVPVVVEGRTGQPMPDLREEDFRLLVDGRPVPIEVFERGAQSPLSLIVLQDLSGSMAEPGKMEASRNALDCLLDTARTHDEIALATFAGGQARVEVPFTGELATLRESMAVWQAWGTTGLYDAVAWLPEITVGAERTSRAAILVTDGVDNASAVPPGQAEQLVRQAKLPVYVLGLTAGRRRAPADGTFRYDQLLEQLARQSGGRYYAVADPTAARRACAALLTELRLQYVLGFSVSGVGGARFHPLTVEVRPRRARPTHRGGYHGTAPSAHQGNG